MTNRLLTLILLITPLLATTQPKSLPHLERRGEATQLIVDQRPFIVLGGELGNSSTSAPSYMANRWSGLVSMGLNTVLAPVYWELIEPEEGRFDFSSLDSMVERARANNLRLVLLWFGSWKNSMSCYAPMWVKKDFNSRFQLAKKANGEYEEILSAFSQENMLADKRAYVKLMEHIKAIDSREQTIIMMQVENEIGMLGSAREYGEQANKLFDSQVPASVMRHILNKKESLQPHLYNCWKRNGSKTSGNWREVFGSDLAADEIFMAYHYGVYVEEIAKAGRKVYDLPIYLNAALNSRGRKPGEYPSAGPLAHLIDIWRVAAPSVDMLSPDIYDPGFASWVDSYTLEGNPLFVPEIRLEPQNGARVFYALGACSAIGFSPFSIEDVVDIENYPLAKAFKLLTPFLPLVAQKQSEAKIYGVWFDSTATEKVLEINGIKFTARHDLTLGWSAEAKDKSRWGECGALIMDVGNDKFVVVGTGVVMTIKSLDNNKLAGIGEVDEISIKNGAIISERRLNGDQTHQGRHLRIPFNSYGAQRLKVYRCGK